MPVAPLKTAETVGLNGGLERFLPRRPADIQFAKHRSVPEAAPTLNAADASAVLGSAAVAVVV